MSEFIRRFKVRGEISFIGMRDTAMSLLPNDKVKLHKLHDDLKRGTDILDDDDHLNMYLRSFGKMHKAKLDTAFTCLPSDGSVFTEDIEVFDWGCGQGTAIICLLDFLSTQKIPHHIRQINLIDPSIAAVDRASRLIPCFDSNYIVNKITKTFDTLTPDDFEKSNVKKLHLFSNILDVDAFDLAQFTHLFQQSFFGVNYFVCVGPYYSNNKRMDEFIAATEPDDMFAIANKERGTWIKDWTISMRVFYKDFHLIDSLQDIRKRIENSHKKQQFFAGYILDAVSAEYEKTDLAEETEELYNSLSAFDVKSNVPLNYNTECDPKLAVLANIVSRGLPTKAPLKLENYFSDLFQISEKPKGKPILNYASKHRLTTQAIYEALHVIDPRFNVDFYNGNMLNSNFEKAFVEKYLKGTASEYLIQILEPQRPLSSIVDIPDKKFSKDQRVDFAIEVPYGNCNTGFILEIDGAPYHSNLFQKLRDERRDRISSLNGWDTYRIEQLKDYSFLHNWEQETTTNRYLSIIKKNFSKPLTGNWKDTLQIVLSPLAIARLERIILEAMMSGALDITAKAWNLVVIERDVPCAAIAIDELQEKYERICSLAGSGQKMPKINLYIVSTKEFKDSPLHIGKAVSTISPKSHFDLCIDISMLLRDNIDALPLNVSAEFVYLIRSSHYKKRKRTICTAENIVYPPFVSKDSTGSYVNIKEREEVLTYFLQNIFRKSSFRPGQLPILSRSLSDQTTIGLLPTGGGKSLTYQLSCILQPGVTIVVDPLVSLMVDQVRGLREIRIDACDCVNSRMNGIEKTNKLNLLQNGALLFILLSPERFMMENFRESLIAMTERNHVYFAYGVIDEVHCVSEWGHDFRTSYLHLGRNMINFMRSKSKRPLSIIGLTATASFDVLADVERELTLGGKLSIDSETVVRSENDVRPELTYRIVNVISDFDKVKEPLDSNILKVGYDNRILQQIVADTKKQRMYQLLKEIPYDIENINNADNSSNCHIEGFSVTDFYLPTTTDKYPNAGIIFCPHAHGSWGVMDSQTGNHCGISTGLLTEMQNLQIGTFVGGDNPSEDMRSFNENDLNLMVATKAFGMGIDKSNIRFTINFNHPSSIESFVQEAGRGGRDKKHAISYILYEPTEFIHFTVDKVNRIREKIKKTGDDPTWLENYCNKYILLEDFPTVCKKHECSDKQVESLLNYIHNQGFLENIDKNINLWFHNNSFRGLYKEKVILLEMTDRILNVKPNHIVEIQGRLRDETGNDDIHLKVNPQKNTLSILSEEDKSKQYGYIFLDSLHPTFKFINFDQNTCSHISQNLIEILKTYKDYSAKALLKPLEGEDNITEGIYNALAKTDADGYVFVTVSWENNIQQDTEEFERSIKEEIGKIANQQDWKNINEDRYGELKLNFVSDFDSLIDQIYKCSGDSRWLRYHDDDDHKYEYIYKKLKLLFCKKRDKNDTDKAIYRMCCVGLVEDVTIDYLSQTYKLKIRKHSDEEFKQHMLNFFRKYYSLEQAQTRVNEIDKQQGRNYLDKCLGYLTKFVYNNLKKKRHRAIEDMHIACEDSVANRAKTGNDDWLKEFIHLYFNSKYARIKYFVNEKNYSLTEDTDTHGRDDFDIVKKYIEIMNQDSSGSEVDNVKHLYGATLLCLRAHPDNAALQLLLTYCITFLGTGSNETLKTDAFKGYVEGFMEMYKKKGSKVLEDIDYFNSHIKMKVHDDYIQEAIVEHGKETIMLFIHEDKLNHITNKYLNKE